MTAGTGDNSPPLQTEAEMVKAIREASRTPGQRENILAAYVWSRML